MDFFRRNLEKALSPRSGQSSTDASTPSTTTSDSARAPTASGPTTETSTATTSANRINLQNATRDELVSFLKLQAQHAKKVKEDMRKLQAKLKETDAEKEELVTSLRESLRVQVEENESNMTKSNEWKSRVKKLTQKNEEQIEHLMKENREVRLRLYSLLYGTQSGASSSVQTVSEMLDSLESRMSSSVVSEGEDTKERISVLEKEKVDLLEQIETWKVKTRESWKPEAEHNESHISRMTEELRKIKEQLQFSLTEKREFDDENKSLHERIESLQCELSSVNNVKTEIESECEVHREGLKDLNAKLVKTVDELSATVKEKVTLENVIREKEEEIDLLKEGRSESTELQVKLKSSEEQLSYLRDELENVTEENEKLRKEQEEEMVELRLKVNQAVNQARELEKPKSVVDKTLQELEELMDDDEKMIMAASIDQTTESAPPVSEDVGVECSSLRSMLAERESELESLNDEISELSDMLTAEKEKNKTLLLQFEGERSRNEEVVEKLKVDIQRKNEEISALHAQVNEVSNSLEKEISLAKDECDRRGDECMESKAVVDRLKENFDRATQDVRRLQNEKDAILREVRREKSERDKENEQRMKLSSERDHLVVNVTKLQQRTRELESQLSEQEDVVGEFERVAEERLARIGTLESQLEELKGLESQNEDYTGQVSALRKELESQREREEELTELVHVLRRDNDEFSKQLVARDDEMSSVRQQVETISEAYEKYKGRAKVSLLKKSEELEELKRSQATEVGILRKTITNLEMSVQSLEEDRNRSSDVMKENTSVMDENEDMKRLLVVKEDEVLQLREQISSVAQAHQNEVLELQNKMRWELEERRKEIEKISGERDASLKDLTDELNSLRESSRKQMEEKGREVVLTQRKLLQLQKDLLRAQEGNNRIHADATVQTEELESVCIEPIQPVEIEPKEKEKVISKEAEAEKSEQDIMHFAMLQAERDGEVGKSNEHIRQLELMVEDTENTLRLLLEEDSVLKEEIRELERCRKRDWADKSYLKNVVVKFLATTDHMHRTDLLTVIGNILQFSPNERRQVREKNSHGFWSSWIPGAQ